MPFGVSWNTLLDELQGLAEQPVASWQNHSEVVRNGVRDTGRESVTGCPEEY